MLKVQFPASTALERRLESMRQAALQGGRKIGQVKADIKKIVEDDHVDKMLRGVTRYGTLRDKLAPRTLANPKRGGGPPLLPRRMGSRYITTYRALWIGRSLVQRFVDFVSDKGFPIPVAHETGARRGKWILPPRPVMGITPRGWAAIVKRHNEYARECMKGD